MKNKYMGFWFTPNNTEKTQGILTINEESGITLELYGIIKNTTQNNDNSNNINIINGITNENEKITLQGCFMTYSSWGTNGCVSKYMCNRLYIGQTYTSNDDIKFNQLSFSTNNLNDWLWNSSFNFITDETNKTFKVEYKLPELIRAQLNDQYSLCIETNVTLPPYSIPQYEISITENVFINICSTSSESLDAFLRLKLIFECFLKIAIGVNQNVYEMRGYSNGEVVEIFLYQHSNNYKNIKVFPPFMPLRYGIIKEKWENIISTWYNNYEEYEDILNLYFSVNNNTNTFIQHKFLFYVQVLESYHRKKHYSDRTEEKNKIKAIISDCPKKHQSFLKDALKFAHEISLKQRLEELCNECDIMDILLNIQYKISREAFIKAIKDNRNYYTHYDTSMKRKQVDDQTLYYITTKINIMIHYFLLKDLGFDENDRFEILKRLDRELLM